MLQCVTAVPCRCRLTNPLQHITSHDNCMWKFLTFVSGPVRGWTGPKFVGSDPGAEWSGPWHWTQFGPGPDLFFDPILSLSPKSGVWNYLSPHHRDNNLNVATSQSSHMYISAPDHITVTTTSTTTTTTNILQPYLFTTIIKSRDSGKKGIFLYHLLPFFTN